MISLPLLSVIVKHCRSKKKWLGTFVFNDNTDNVRQSFYNIHVCNGGYRFPYCRTLSNIVVLKNKGLDIFVFNDNSDND